MYIYDRNKEQKNHALYILAKGHKYIELFAIPTSITSVLERNETLLFATENKLFSINLKSKELKALAALPKDKEIESIAVDTASNSIYFSTNSMVYALKDTSKVIITDQFGGILRFFNDGLIVFNPDKKFLIRIVGIEDQIASKMQELKAAANGTQRTNVNKESRSMTSALSNTLQDPESSHTQMPREILPVLRENLSIPTKRDQAKLFFTTQKELNLKELLGHGKMISSSKVIWSKKTVKNIMGVFMVMNIQVVEI